MQLKDFVKLFEVFIPIMKQQFSSSGHTDLQFLGRKPVPSFCYDVINQLKSLPNKTITSLKHFNARTHSGPELKVGRVRA